MFDNYIRPCKWMKRTVPSDNLGHMDEVLSGQVVSAAEDFNSGTEEHTKSK